MDAEPIVAPAAGAGAAGAAPVLNPDICPPAAAVPVGGGVAGIWVGGGVVGGGGTVGSCCVMAVPPVDAPDWVGGASLAFLAASSSAWRRASSAGAIASFPGSGVGAGAFFAAAEAAFFAACCAWYAGSLHGDTGAGAGAGAGAGCGWPCVENPVDSCGVGIGAIGDGAGAAG